MKGKKRVKKAPPSEKTLKKKVCQKGASFRKEEISMKRIVHAVCIKKNEKERRKIEIENRMIEIHKQKMK